MIQVRDQAEQVAEHMEGMANYFAGVETSLTAIKEEVIRQILCFNCVVGIEFELDDNRDRTNYIVNTFYDVAGDVNVFLLYPSMSLLDGKGKSLFSVKGESEYETFRPMANADLLEEDRPEAGDVDMARRDRSIACLKEAGVPYGAFALRGDGLRGCYKEPGDDCPPCCGVVFRGVVVGESGSGRDVGLRE